MSDARTMIEKAFAQAENAPPIRQANLSIWGGQVAEADLPAFLAHWGEALEQQMAWRFYEYVSEFAVIKATAKEPALPVSVAYLERGRLFGTGGDLDLRRDGDLFRWRFVGEKAAWTPDLSVYGTDYWVENAGMTLREVETKTLQWRQNEDRVGGDWLDYAGIATNQHSKIYLKQKHYLHNGNIEFVWFTNLEAS